ncbi:hypothetical protein, partial [Streptomyces sp. SID4917]|uniref:hypothetical protein n=1 Tax=Streptomyces sp. SID4917 TaxID=2690269 RepID=UPI001F1ACF2A
RRRRCCAASWRARAAGIAECLTGVVLGSAQEVWGEVHGQTSDTLHGWRCGSGPGRSLYPAGAAARPRCCARPWPG